MSNLTNRQLYLLFGLASISYLLGLFAFDVMDVDSAQYASISREMMDSNGFLQVKHRLKDYLDKPPLLFWLTALSFKVFGAHDWLFRFIPFLTSILGVYSTFKLGGELYNRRTGIFAALMLFTCQAFFMINHDVRTDTILTNMVIFSIWQIFLFLKHRQAVHFFLGFLGIGLSMLAKGPIGLMVPVLAFTSHFLYTRSWKNFIRWEWLLGIALVLLILSPMLWGLYQQFGHEGVEFFFWTQSFGRITGENVWKNNAGYFFFSHTFLWAFLPWMCLAIFGIIKNLFALIKSKCKYQENIEVLSLGGFLLAFIAFSFSHYKLPHYIFVVFPLCAIIAGHTLDQILSNTETKKSYKLAKIFFWIQSSIAVLLWTLGGLICFYLFKLEHWIVLIPILILVLATGYFMMNKEHVIRILVPSALAIIGINFIMNIHFYPRLMEYHSGSNIAHYINEDNIPKEACAFFLEKSHATEFYAGSIFPFYKETENLIQGLEGKTKSYIITNEKGRDAMTAEEINYSIKKTFPHYHVTALRGKFLNPNTRAKATSQYFVLEVLPKNRD